MFHSLYIYKLCVFHQEESGLWYGLLASCRKWIAGEGNLQKNLTAYAFWGPQHIRCVVGHTQKHSELCRRHSLHLRITSFINISYGLWAGQKLNSRICKEFFKWVIPRHCTWGSFCSTPGSGCSTSSRVSAVAIPNDSKILTHQLNKNKIIIKYCFSKLHLYCFSPENLECFTCINYWSLITATAIMIRVTLFC